MATFVAIALPLRAALFANGFTPAANGPDGRARVAAPSHLKARAARSAFHSVFEKVAVRSVGNRLIGFCYKDLSNKVLVANVKPKQVFVLVKNDREIDKSHMEDLGTFESFAEAEAFACELILTEIAEIASYNDGDVDEEFDAIEKLILAGAHSEAREAWSHAQDSVWFYVHSQDIQVPLDDSKGANE